MLARFDVDLPSSPGMRQQCHLLPRRRIPFPHQGLHVFIILLMLLVTGRSWVLPYRIHRQCQTNGVLKPYGTSSRQCSLLTKVPVHMKASRAEVIDDAIPALPCKQLHSSGRDTGWIF